MIKSHKAFRGTIGSELWESARLYSLANKYMYTILEINNTLFRTSYLADPGVAASLKYGDLILLCCIAVTGSRLPHIMINPQFLVTALFTRSLLTAHQIVAIVPPK